MGPSVGPSGTPPSRRGKKQIIAYIDMNLATRAERKAHREAKTNQEIIAEAINRILTHHGYAALLPVGHIRIVRRYRKKAAARLAETVCHARTGKRAFGGWFPKENVDDVIAAARDLESSVQRLLEEGLEMLLDESAKVISSDVPEATIHS